jgi:hypothetical protein
MHDLARMCTDIMMGSGGALMMGGMIVFTLAALALVFVGVRWLWRRAHDQPRG